MNVISLRQLSDDNVEVIRRVEQGESFTVTRHGAPVARLVPFTSDLDLRCDRPASKKPAYGALQRVHLQKSTDKLLLELRGDR
jgi:prevent-host-death family protein